MKNKIILVFVLLLLLTGCGKSELDTILESNNYIVIDVRTSEEYNEGHVKDSINIPYDEINEEIDLDNTKTLLVYCKSGVRSKIAYDKLKELGYSVYDLGGYSSIKMEKE